MPARDITATKSSRFLVLAAICIVIAALYFAQEVLIPLALSILICFLLAPVSTRLERFGLPRVPAVLIVALVAFSIIFAIGWTISVQIAHLGNQLTQYQGELVRKVRTVSGKIGGGEFFQKIEHAGAEFEKATTQPATQPSTQAATKPAGASSGTSDVPTALEEVAQHPAESALRDVAGAPAAIAPAIGTTRQNPWWVVALPAPESPLRTLGTYVQIIVGPLGMMGLIVVFVIFMLIQREDLRDRLIRLGGGGRLHVTTQALDDAGSRISRYLLAQSMVNGSFGILVTVGLAVIGRFVGGVTFPSFVLWGVLGALLRFIPYVGVWIGAAFPLILSLAVYHGFGVFWSTLGMYIVIELMTSNFLEPWLYGSSTGMSTVAVLVSAVFWTWLWGPIGLLLATPLTVCVVVLGKYVPQLAFLDILLGDEPVLTPPERVYQRLLALDADEASKHAREALEATSLEQVYDEVLLPALAMAEEDCHHGVLDDTRREFIQTSMRSLVEEMADLSKQRAADQQAQAMKDAAADVVSAAKGDSSSSSQPATEPTNPPPAKPPATARAVVPPGCTVNVICLPAHDEADEIVTLMLGHLLASANYCSFTLSVAQLASEMVDAVQTHHANAVVVSALPPAAITHSRYLCKRLQNRYPDLKLVVGLWTIKGDLAEARHRVVDGNAPEVRLTTTLRQTLDELSQLVQGAIVAAGKTAGSSTATAASPSANPR